MVNDAATLDATAAERRDGMRATATHAGVFGGGVLNPFGDLHALQHASARLARGARPVLEPLLRAELRTWAEPLSVQRLADYRAERPAGASAWLPLAMASGDAAFLVLDGALVMRLLDLFFGGAGTAPADAPAEFSPAADALVARLGAALAGPLATAWEPVARIGFVPGRPDAAAAGLDGEDAVVATRIGFAAGSAKPAFLDLVYPVAALKPHAPSLTGKVVAKPAAPDETWRAGITRAMMNVRLPVRSVLAEPHVPLSLLMNLKPGDVIPIGVPGDVPVMVGGGRLGAGTVGVSNGQAAIRLTQFTRPEGPNQ